MTWCPRCASRAVCERKKLTAADMHQTARQFGGEFLSPEYLGAAVKHEWRCHRGHRFWQTPNNVRRAEGGRRTATFCKKCTVMDKSIVKASVLAGLGSQEAKRTQAALEETGAMPTRRYFLPRRAKGRRPAMPRRVRARNSGDCGSEPTNSTT